MYPRIIKLPSSIHTFALYFSPLPIVIGLAPSETPIARSASIAIEIDAKEDIQIYTPLSSRIAHLAVIDVLAIGVAQKKGPQLQAHLQQLQSGLSSLRVD